MIETNDQFLDTKAENSKKYDMDILDGVLKLIRSTSISWPLSSIMNSILGWGLREVDNLGNFGT